MEDGWTVDLMRDDLTQHQGAASDATVRRQLQAGDGVYKRFATTVPRNAPTAENQKPGGQQWSPPSVASTRHGRSQAFVLMPPLLPMHPTSNAAGFAWANRAKSRR